MIIRDPHYLNDEETAYAMNILTHVDFLIYDKLGKQPVLAVEVDRYAYHNQNKKQEQRDNLKDEILHKYNTQIARFKTNESNEKKRLTEILSHSLLLPISYNVPAVATPMSCDQF